MLYLKGRDANHSVPFSLDQLLAFSIGSLGADMYRPVDLHDHAILHTTFRFHSAFTNPTLAYRPRPRRPASAPVPTTP